MENTHYKNASDISCLNMFKLAKKHSDENHSLFINRMISNNCKLGDENGYSIYGEIIEPKHCHNKRAEYNYDWWDNQHTFCVGDKFNINTKSKFNKVTNKSQCIPTDFSKINLINQSNNFNYNTPKTCNMI